MVTFGVPGYLPEYLPISRRGMSISEPGEMAPERSKAVVLPKFDMHVITSDLTSDELKTTVDEYAIPEDLHPRLPPPESLFSFENKTGGRARKCFKEVTTSLKGWKKKFFVIDRRAIPDAMPWRYGDTNLHDDFPANYDETDVARISEFLVPLRPPPRHLLYVCVLTTACRHPELRYDIKDNGKNVIDMDTFLKLPSWTGTVVKLTVAQKNLEKPDAKVAAAREKKERQNLAKAEAKRTGADVGGTLSVTPRQAIPEIVKTTVVATPEVAKVVPDVEKVVVDLSGNTRVSTPPVEVNQPSPPRQHDNTQVSPHLDAHSQYSPHGHGDESLVDKYVPNWGLRSDLRICTPGTCKELVSHLATPAEDEFLGGLSNADIVGRAYLTLGQSVATQEEILKRHEQLCQDYVDLGSFGDVQSLELDRLRSSLQIMTQDNNVLNKRLVLLDGAHSECMSRDKELSDRVNDLERERDEWRSTASDQVEKIRSLEKDLEPRTQQLIAAEEKVKALENEKLALSAQLAQAETDRKKLVREFIPTVVKRLHASVEYRKSLAEPVQLCFTAGWLGGLSLGRTEDEITRFLSETEDLDIEGSKSWEAKHHELFKMSYPYVQKVAASYDLPMSDLLKVSLDVPAPLNTKSNPKETVENASQQPLHSTPKTTTDLDVAI
ncbi:hypothetical protein Tco_0752557 [Tanacetum coccineum]|uniref:Uncharacterized protein n=1 Tax=Tanacetum coccineum TaxID=301880 RepID=A0ABQ4Z8F3_9ASTR